MSKKVENTIILNSDDGDIEVEVIEQTVLNGKTYLLVADITDEEEDSDCYILEDVSKSDDDEASYIVVPNDEADKIYDAFSKLLGDDVDLKK